MHTPTAALTWELWRRHRLRLMTVVGIVLGLALVYPKLCALAGFNPRSPDAVQELLEKIGPMHDSVPELFRFIFALDVMFLFCGPLVAMVLTLLYVTWVFTFTEVDQRTKDPMKFPARLFTLPVSTSFLYWRIMLGGMAAILVLYSGWVYCVPLPHVELFSLFQNCFSWMTLLALTQGIVWSLAGWPITRALLLFALLFGFLLSSARRDIFESPFVLLPLFLLGIVLARAGLQKMRHGQWQGWTWQWPFAARAARAELRGPKRFASPAQAQLWFEWRQFARRFFFYAAGLALVPVVLHLLCRVVVGRTLEDNTVLGFAAYLAGIPLIIHFCFAVDPGQSDVSFLLIRPLTGGEIVMARLKAAAISAALSWGAVLAGIGLLPLLGDFHKVNQTVAGVPGGKAAIVVVLMFLTWRLVAANLCFVLTGKRWAAALPTLVFCALVVGVRIIYSLDESGLLRGYFLQSIVFIVLPSLIVVKFLLACLAFRASLQRGLLSSDALLGYLTVWFLLVAGLVSMVVILSPRNIELMMLEAMLIVLLVPLARIGFCPITLARYRHA